MNQPLSLKSAERKVFQTSMSDGLWDVFIGCFVLMFAIAPLLSESLGDFWSSFIFLPFWGLVYLAIWLMRKYVVAPRMGTVRFSEARRLKIRRFSIVLVVVNTLALVLGLLVLFLYGRDPASGSARLSGIYPYAFGAFLLVGFSIAAYLLDCPRFFVYGLMLFIAAPVGEWLSNNYGASHHGYPIVFGFVAGVMILTGVVLFIWLLIKNPLVDDQVG